MITIYSHTFGAFHSGKQLCTQMVMNLFTHLVITLIFSTTKLLKHV